MYWHADKHRHHSERHRVDRTGWLRAAVLGADDGIVSTASLMIGVAASNATKTSIFVAGMAGLVGGAMSMAVGEYVSVSSQKDSEQADIARERVEQREDPQHELTELTEIYRRRGLDGDLARKVAIRLMEVDPLGSHLRDELGLDERTMARPVQAAAASAGSFAIGGALPLVAMLVAPSAARIAAIALASLICLTFLGGVGGQVGGAPRRRGAMRVAFGGAIAMAVTAVIGSLVGIAV
ncbi:MAG: vacuolar iron transporter family protein [Acidimicrobiia bacterium]|jgi:VIT1/CCC1 family predicted Fe2+/Mn2+ transporter|nr:vacuolar iron transporter family protein [Acidimicrobiia bacterium]